MRLLRAIPRAIECLHLLSGVAVDGPSRGALLKAYSGMLTGRWEPGWLAARLRFPKRVFDIRFRGRDVYVVGEILHDRVYALERSLGPNPVIIDAGANIGLSALWFLALYPSCTLHCFEPDPESFALLAQNTGSYASARIQCAAVDEIDGVVPLLITGRLSDHRVLKPGSPESGVPVRSLRLDSYLHRANISRVDLLKLDVEGSELSVLRGLGDRIYDVQVLVGELHVRMVDPRIFYQFLTSKGFRIVQTRRTRHSDRLAVQLFEARR